MKTYLATAALGVAFAAGGAWMLTRPAETALGQTEVLPGAAMAQEADAAEIDTSTIEDMVLGDPDAPVTLTEYASFTCPHCAAFHAEQWPQIKENYVDTGKVRFVYREVYFDRPGLWASMVARCGGDMRFFGIADTLYDTQREWAGSGDLGSIADNLRRIGLTSGIDQEQLDACLNDGTMAQTLYTWYQENAEEYEVNSTPTLFIDDEKYSNMAYDELAALLDARLEEVGYEEPAGE
ncbi:DsbA family protein [Wenxinia marina]|uniref:Protein-disulfide isomerase n=1 Tax=Wenxinia marina DSM 24838 TaxID=1123501 RepID=A0A0D0QJH1_9RHOB|nr:DsbA family protein [Wenxinia marina]KIQ71163.1 Protein-disulfide isomerase [Wenxinia marina DSM 24838]GGL54347.1 thiol-disulfide oxidoreductase [Wenxinia marina]